MSTILDMPLSQPPELTVAEVVRRRDMIKSAMKSAMEAGIHYGTIPGCGDKPTLLQPGAQTLAFLFQIRPEYTLAERNFPDGHREWQVTCKMIHQSSNREVGQGVGMCSTMEAKYRLRKGVATKRPFNWTEEPVPPVYWHLRDKGTEVKNRWLSTLFGAERVANIGTEKDEANVWRFVEYHGDATDAAKQENPNIADCYNTVLKMAKKRAYVDATITTTASSDLFTQDLEDELADIPEVKAGPAPEVHRPEPEKEKTSRREPKPEEAAPAATKPPATAPTHDPVPNDGKDWRRVRVHFGTDGGKVKGRELGTLARSTIDWLNAYMAKLSRTTEQDKILLVALAEEHKSRNPREHHAELRARCEKGAILFDHMLRVLQKNGSQAKSFDDIPEDEAKHALTNWEQTLQQVMDESDKLPMGDAAETPDAGKKPDAPKADDGKEKMPY